jgi:hypothetical protein
MLGFEHALHAAIFAEAAVKRVGRRQRGSKGARHDVVGDIDRVTS